MIRFYQTPIQRRLFLMKIKQEPTLKRIIKRNVDLTSEINHDIKLRISGMIENFYTAYIIGQQGTFKTSLAITLAKKFDPTFSEKRVFFQYEEYREDFKTSNPKETRQLDEQVFQHGMGSSRLLHEIQELIETLRQRQNSLIIVSPDPKYFDEKIFTYTFETIDTAIIGTCKYDKKNHEVRECQCYYEEKNFPKITECYVRAAIKTQEQYVGLYISQVEWKNKTFVDYQERKKSFMNDIVQGKKSRPDYESMAREILSKHDTENYKNKKQLSLLVQKIKPNLTTGETELVITAIMMIRKGDL